MYLDSEAAQGEDVEADGEEEEEGEDEDDDNEEDESAEWLAHQGIRDMLYLR